MTVLEGRPNTAVLVIDAQRGVMEASVHAEEVVDRISGIVDKARSAGTPVVWIQHSSDELPIESEVWRIVPELVPTSDEPVVRKRYGDSFEATDLEEVLRSAGVGHLIVTGAQSDACIRSTIHGAFTRGYDVTLVSDAHTTEDLTEWGAPAPDDVIAHTNLYWSFQEAPGRTAKVVDAAALDVTG